MPSPPASPGVPAFVTRARARKAALDAVRRYFDGAGLLETETPILVPGTGLEPHIDPLATAVRAHVEERPRRRYLHTSPEIQLKRMIARGLGPAYQIARVFRDGERTARHRPEFTLIEWYRPGGTLAELQADTVALVRVVADALKRPVPGGGAAPRRVTVRELFAAEGIDLAAALDAGGNALVEAVKQTGRYHLRTAADFDDAFFAVMARIEDGWAGAGITFVERYCAQHAALARLCDDDARFAARFEMYVGGMELANAFDELTDPDVQRTRFAQDNALRVTMGKVPLDVDEAFLEDLASMPRCVGVALGLERLMMAVLGSGEIGDVALGLDDDG